MPYEEMRLDGDKLIDTISEWARNDTARASEVGEMRAEIKDFLDDYELNKKGLSIIRALDKMADDKRADVLRTFDHLRDLMGGRWESQVQLPFDGDSGDTTLNPFNPDDDEVIQFRGGVS